MPDGLSPARRAELTVQLAHITSLLRDDTARRLTRGGAQRRVDVEALEREAASIRLRLGMGDQRDVDLLTATRSPWTSALGWLLLAGGVAAILTITCLPSLLAGG